MFAFGRTTSFAVSLVLALKRVNIVAVNAILVLHVGTTGRRTVGRTPLGLHVTARCDTTVDDQERMNYSITVLIPLRINAVTVNETVTLN